MRCFQLAISTQYINMGYCKCTAYKCKLIKCTLFALVALYCFLPIIPASSNKTQPIDISEYYRSIMLQLAALPL